MRAIVRYIPLFALFGLLSACASESLPGAGSSGDLTDVPETEDQMILNALGQALSQSIGDAGFSPEEFAFVQRGLRDAVLGRDALHVMEIIEATRRSHSSGTRIRLPLWDLA